MGILQEAAQKPQLGGGGGNKGIVHSFGCCSRFSLDVFSLHLCPQHVLRMTRFAASTSRLKLEQHDLVS